MSWAANNGTYAPSYGGKPALAYLDYVYSFATEIAENEPTDTITMPEVLISPPDGSLGASYVSAVNGEVTFWLAAGIPGTIYTLTVVARTAAGRVLVSEPSPIVIVT